MEILIIGGILVAVMAYVSTKIKRTTVDAYAREIIETDEFSLVKPDGYIVLAGIVPFAATSQESGTDTGEKLKQSRADLRVYEGKTFDEICRNAKQNAGKIISEDSIEDGGLKYLFMHARKPDGAATVEIFYKIIGDAQRGKIYELQVRVLDQAMATFSSKASEMLQTFVLKSRK